VVDTDLRWRLLQSLVAHGAATVEEIDTTLESDPTATGQRQAERTRALRPEAEVKAEAWRRAIHDDELPNAINEAIISGFSHPAQKALLADYVTAYFADVADVWERRSSERAQPVATGLYPHWAVDPATVEAADAWLADESHPPALRRLVSEGRAGTLRALAARDFDRQ
jgi:aminopeptidase N